MTGQAYTTPAGETDGQRPATAVEVVLNYIRTQIFQRKLRVGDRLPTEGELSELLGVGRGSVREAVKRLEALQLLNIRRGDGTYIADMREVTVFDSLLYKIVLEDINFSQVMDYRIQMEMSVMQLAIRDCTEQDIALMRQASEEFARCVTERHGGTADELTELDLNFHRELGRACKNQLLADMYMASLELFAPSIRLNYSRGQAVESPRETIKTHRLMVEALERRDVNAAAYAVINATELWRTWNVANEDGPMIGL